MEKFTKGEWTVELSRETLWVWSNIGHANADIVLHTDFCLAYKTEVKEKRLANITLAAAAPALYEALKELVAATGTLNYKDYESAMDKSRAALEKAVTIK